MSVKLLTTILLSLSMLGCASQDKKNAKILNSSKEWNDMQRKLDSLFNASYSAGTFNGNVLIASGDTILFQKSYGIANHSTGQLLNDSSVFELASVSKQFTAMAIVLLKEKGKLNYADSLRYFFPELPYSNITVKHLLHHTSGLPDYMELVMRNTKAGSIATNESMIALLAEHKPSINFKPGEKWEYSNTGYALLASIVEKASGKSFADFLQSAIFTPLGMTHTEVYHRRYDKRTISNYALGYVPGGKGNFILDDSVPGIRDYVTLLDGISGDGTVISTTSDLLKWSVASDKHLLVSEAVQKEIFTAGTLNNGSQHGYGYGWMIMKAKPAGHIITHTGGWPGYATLIEKHPDHGKTIIVLSNHDQSGVVFKKIKDILYNITETAPKEIKLESGKLADYAGTYELAPDFKITITAKDDKLFAQATGQGEYEVFAEKEDLFFYKVVEAKIKFNRNEKNEIISLTLLQEGQEIPGKKIN